LVRPPHRLEAAEIRRDDGPDPAGRQHVGDVPGEGLHRQVAVVQYAVHGEQDAAGGGRHVGERSGTVTVVLCEPSSTPAREIQMS
jgi:hypothetical protein